MAACAAFGLRAAYAGAVGTDDNGRRVESALADRGVDLSLLVRRAGGNQFAAILIEQRLGRARRAVGSSRLAAARGRGPAVRDALRSARAVLVDDVDPRASLEAARLARAAGVPVVTDLDHLTPFTEALVRTASHPVLSEHLPQALTGEGDMERALRALRSWNPGLLTVTRRRSAEPWRSTATTSCTPTAFRSTPWIRPDPATYFAAPSSSDCCRACRPTGCCASPTPRRR